MRSEQEVIGAIERYADTVRRICLTYLKSPHDTEDVFQTVFVKYALSSPVFDSAEHEKAWVIRVTINACKDWLKSLFRHRTVPLEEAREQASDLPAETVEVMDAIAALPERYRTVIYLHYYEGYTAEEIGCILHKNKNTVYTWLTRAKPLLKEALGGDENARTHL